MAIEIRKGTRSDLEGFLDLLYQVRGFMDQGIMELWVAMDGSRMAGALNILHPGLADCNYGYDLGFDEVQLRKVVCMDTAAVHPDYRGRGIQKRLLETAETYLQGTGERYLLCTIHPENRFSLNNALKQGYEIRRTLEKYGSVRHILCKKIF